MADQNFLHSLAHEKFCTFNTTFHVTFSAFVSTVNSNRIINHKEVTIIILTDKLLTGC